MQCHYDLVEKDPPWESQGETRVHNHGGTVYEKFAQSFEVWGGFEKH